MARGKRLKVALVLLIILSVAACSYIRGRSVGKSTAREAHKVQEAALVKGFTAAIESTEKKLSEAVSSNEALSGEIERLVAEVERVSGQTPEIRTVTKWRTERIEVPGETLVHEIEVPIQGPANCTWPKFEFSVAGTNATVKSELGNLWASGSVELWREEPPPRQLLGGAPWQADLTEFMVSAQPEPPKRRPWAVGASLYRGDVDAWGVWGERDLGRARLRAGLILADFRTADLQPVDSYFVPFESSESVTVVEAGVGWTF